MLRLLKQAGFNVVGRRAECVHCRGHARLTVSFNDQVAHCHRCKWSANKYQIEKGLGMKVKPRRIGKSKLMKKRFFVWLWDRYGKLADQERKLARKAEWAKAALTNFPDWDMPLDHLAKWYHARRNLESFAEKAQDKIGRYRLYRAWRKS